MKTFKLLSCCVLLTFPVSLGAQSNSTFSGSDSVKKFVQGFYDWYVPKALSNNSEPASNTALKEKGNLLSSELLQKLREDAEAQAHAEGEIVGLDFDPFLSGQDPGWHYSVGKVVPNGESYFVEVYRVVPGKPAGRILAVTAEVRGKNGHWYFVNFFYPNGHNLLGVLKALKDDRVKANP